MEQKYTYVCVSELSNNVDMKLFCILFESCMKEFIPAVFYSTLDSSMWGYFVKKQLEKFAS